jgi:DNA primase
VAEAVPVMEFYLAAYTAGLDLKSPQDQNTALERLIPLLAELDGAQQRVYISRVEQVVGIRAELIIDLLRGDAASARPQLSKGARAKGKGRRPGEPEPRRPGVWEAPPPPDDTPHPAEAGAPAPRRPAVDVHRSPEAYLLTLALRHPTVDAAVEAQLEQGLVAHPALRDLLGGGLEDLLEDPANRAIWAQFTVLPPEWRPTTPEDLAAWAAGLDEQLRERAEQLVGAALRRPDDYRYRQEAEHCARGIRADQARSLQRRMLQRLAEEPDGDHSATLARLGALTAFLADATTPRRSSTFPDLRDVLGKQ